MAVHRSRRRKGRIDEAQQEWSGREDAGEKGSEGMRHECSTSQMVSGTGRGMLALVMLLTARQTEGFHFMSPSKTAGSIAAHAGRDGGVAGVGRVPALGSEKFGRREGRPSTLSRGGRASRSGVVGTGGKWLRSSSESVVGPAVEHLVPAPYKWALPDLSFSSSSASSRSLFPSMGQASTPATFPFILYQRAAPRALSSALAGEITQPSLAETGLLAWAGGCSDGQGESGFFHLDSELGPLCGRKGGESCVEDGEDEEEPSEECRRWSRTRRRAEEAVDPPSASVTLGDGGWKALMREEERVEPGGTWAARGEVRQAFPSMTEQPPPSPQVQGDGPEPNRNDNFTINLGKALDHLRVDVPLLFEREPDLSIYTEDVRLRDHARIYASGKFMYQMVYFSLRVARIFMPMPPLVEVLNIRWCPARQSIEVRFQIRVDTLSDSLYFDAVSVYRVNARGLIYEHLIEKGACRGKDEGGIVALAEYLVLIACLVAKRTSSSSSSPSPFLAPSHSDTERPLGETLDRQPLLRDTTGPGGRQSAHPGQRGHVRRGRGLGMTRGGDRNCDEKHGGSV